MAAEYLQSAEGERFFARHNSNIHLGLRLGLRSRVGNVLFELPWRIYVYTGSDEAIKLCAPHMLRYLDYMCSKRDGSGLFAYGLEDWLPVNVHTPLIISDTILCKSIADRAE